jgi:outer membrane protein assembly factor BamB
MFGLDAVDGQVLWERDLGLVLPMIAAADGVVFALDLASGGLLAVDALAGRPLSKNMTGGEYPTAPVVGGDAVYVGYRNSVQAFSARTGQQLWSYPVDGLPVKLAASGDVLYAAVDGLSSGFALYALRV